MVVILDRPGVIDTVPTEIGWTEAELVALVNALTRRKVLAGGAALAALAGRRLAGAQTPVASPDGPWTFTDDRGVTVTLPKRPERIAAAVHDAAALWDYGVRPIAVFGPQRREDGSQDPQVGEVDLGTVTSLGQWWDDFDLEKLLALQVDLVVSHYYGDPSELWYLRGDALRLVESSVATVAIDYQDVPVPQVIGRLAELAGLLGADLSSPDNAAAMTGFAQAEAELKAAIADKPGLTVLFVDPYEDNLFVANPTIPADLIYYRSLGLDIVVPDFEGFFEALSWEQVNKYPADLILTDARTQALQPEQLDEIETWRSLPAVQAGQVGPWQIGAILSHKSYTGVLRELTEIIRRSRADIVSSTSPAREGKLR